MNAELRTLAVGDMIRDTLVIVQQLSIAVIFCCVYTSCQTRSVSLWQVAALDLGMFGFGVLVTIITQGRLGGLNFSAFKSITLATVVLSTTVFVSAPVFHTLTRNYADDTIYALSITLAFVHLVSADYDFMNGSTAFRGGIGGEENAPPPAAAALQSSSSPAALQQQQQQLPANSGSKRRNSGAAGAVVEFKAAGGAASAAAAGGSAGGAQDARKSSAAGPTSSGAAAGGAAASASSSPQSAASPSPQRVAASSAADTKQQQQQLQLLQQQALDDTSAASFITRRKLHMEHNVSMNAAVVWTVLLASRLDDPRFTAVLLLFGIECFSLSPFVRRAVREASVEVHSGFSLAVFGVALGCLIVTRVSLALGFIAAVLLVAAVLPVSFVKAQDGRFKRQISGQWDEAKPKNSAAAREWANTV